MPHPLRTADFDYALPGDLIAQTPAPERDGSRLLILDRKAGSLRHRTFRDLAEHLVPGDLLVINEAKVVPARLFGRSDRRHQVEVLLLQEIEADRWEVLIKPSRPIRPGDRLALADGKLEVEVVEKRGDGRYLARTPRGRTATRLAFDHFKVSPPVGLQGELWQG